MAGYVERKELDTKKVKECGLPVLWILGGPGSGKSTQCVMLSKVKEMIWINPEELANAEAEIPEPRGFQIKKVLESGGWKALDTPVIVDIIAEAMLDQLENWHGNPEGIPKGFLIDGVPNSVAQAVEFVGRLLPATKIIHISLGPDSLIERLMAKGSTDLEANEMALSQFQQEVIPVLEKYQDKVIKVDGSEMSFLITADINTELMKHKL